eukprot:scaffold67421_cov33-Tisochrysis_lutea.AAC.4
MSISTTTAPCHASTRQATTHMNALIALRHKAQGTAIMHLMIPPLAARGPRLPLELPTNSLGETPSEVSTLSQSTHRGKALTS